MWNTRHGYVHSMEWLSCISSCNVSITSMHLCLLLPTLRNAAGSSGGPTQEQGYVYSLTLKTSPGHWQPIFILLIIQSGIIALICLLCTQGRRFVSQWKISLGTVWNRCSRLSCFDVSLFFLAARFISVSEATLSLKQTMLLLLLLSQGWKAWSWKYRLFMVNILKSH